MTNIDDKALLDGLSWGAIGFGALATLTPRVFEGVYGLRDTDQLRIMTRLWGTRTAVLGVVLLQADDDDRHDIAMLAAAMNAVDALCVAFAGSEVKKRSRVMGALTSAAFAAGYGSVLAGS
ncbi:MAG: hypothetical protein ABIZ50_03745 [Solirubrobacterales bacterium]